MTRARGTQELDTTSTGGFTLVEVMVALVVLALGALATTQLSLAVAVLMNDSTARTELIAHAENKLESVQARGYAAIRPGEERDTVLVRGAPYVRRVTISAAGARTRRIVVELRGPGQATAGYSAQTLVSAP